jgi:hypothetical protein
MYAIDVDAITGEEEKLEARKSLEEKHFRAKEHFERWQEELNKFKSSETGWVLEPAALNIIEEIDCKGLDCGDL